VAIAFQQRKLVILEGAGYLNKSVRKITIKEVVHPVFQING